MILVCDMQVVNAECVVYMHIMDKYRQSNGANGQKMIIVEPLLTCWSFIRKHHFLVIHRITCDKVHLTQKCSS